jgi:hypothetical protein
MYAGSITFLQNLHTNYGCGSVVRGNVFSAVDQCNLMLVDKMEGFNSHCLFSSSVDIAVFISLLDFQTLLQKIWTMSQDLHAQRAVLQLRLLPKLYVMVLCCDTLIRFVCNVPSTKINSGIAKFCL